MTDLLKNKAVFLLCQDGFGVKEIAEKLGLSRDAFETRLMADKQFKEQFDAGNAALAFLVKGAEDYFSAGGGEYGFALSHNTTKEHIDRIAQRHAPLREARLGGNARALSTIANFIGKAAQFMGTHEGHERVMAALEWWQLNADPCTNESRKSLPKDRRKRDMIDLYKFAVGNS